MGKRGPAKTPTALALVRGERRDRINEAEPQPSELEIVAPDWLNDEALAVWARYAPDLEAKKVLTAWDVEAFARWCDAVVRRRRASAMLDEEGEVVREGVFDKGGNKTGERVKKHPAMLVWKSADEVVSQIGARFGLTPSERTAVKVGENAGDSSGKGKERLLS